MKSCNGVFIVNVASRAVVHFKGVARGELRSLRVLFESTESFRSMVGLVG